MAQNKTQSELKDLLAWHKKFESHPLFRSEYAKENLASFVEFFLKVYLYATLIALAGQLMNLFGYIETDTVIWLLIQVGNSALASWLPNVYLLDKIYVSLTIASVVIIILITGYVFRVVKANANPKGNKATRQSKQP
jgi:hypothetical protein